MTSSFDRNIERMRSAERRNLQQSTSQRTAMANLTGQKQIENARDIADKLSGFSDSLKDWKERDIKQKQYEGKLAAREARVENAERLYELSEELKRTKEEDTRFQEIKAEMLRLQGPSAYPDADRIAKLSPWQQVGYAQEKLRLYNESYNDKLEHAMANSTKAITIAGVTFTPKELHDNNITDPVLKDAAIQVIGNDIREAAEIDRFSPEMLKLAGTSDAMTKAKDSMLSKYRQRFTIESSANSRAKYTLEWKNSSKTGDDVYRYLLSTGATVDDKGNTLDNTGAWSQFESMIVAEGVAGYDQNYATNILNQPMPDALAAKLGAKKGTTFAEQWPGKAKSLQTQIQKGIADAINEENKFLTSAGKQKENEFIKETRENGMTAERANEYKAWYGENGMPISPAIKKWETLSERNAREDKDKIEALMAYQQGHITHAQLDRYHPEAALEFRDKATKMEKDSLKQFGSEKKIKAALDQTFTGMGIKTNEKSLAYIEAIENAKADYAEKYARYIGYGYNSKDASHLALYGNMGEVVDGDGNVVRGEEGVITEIMSNLQNSKYVQYGQSVEKTLKPSHVRVKMISEGKREILNDRSIIHKGIIGGDYGHRQITSIRDNIVKYGPKGLYMDKNAISYYQGLVRGRDENWPGLVDAQLKALGHEGLWPNGKPPLQVLLTGKDQEENNIDDPDGVYQLNLQANRALNYPSASSNLYAITLLTDGKNYYTTTSQFDEKSNVHSSLR